MDGVQCTVCKVHKGVASRITRLNDDGMFENAEVMIISGAILVFVLVSLGVSYLFSKHSVNIKKAYEAIKRKVMWNSIIRYFFQSTLQMQMSAATGIYFATKVVESDYQTDLRRLEATA